MSLNFLSVFLLPFLTSFSVHALTDLKAQSNELSDLTYHEGRVFGTSWWFKEGFGLRIFDEATGKLQSSVPLVGDQVESVVAHGNFVYLSILGLDSGQPGIIIINVTPNQEPKIIGRFPIKTTGTHRIKIFGDLMFVATEYEGILFLKIEANGNLTEISRYRGESNWPWGANPNFNNMHLKGKLVFATGNMDSEKQPAVVDVIDISDLGNPKQVSRLEFKVDYWASGSGLKGDSLYFAVRTSKATGHVVVIDMKNVSEPKIINEFDSPVTCNMLDMHVSGNRMFLGDSSSWPALGWYAYDLTDPTDPTFLKKMEKKWGTQISIHGDMIYRATEDGFAKSKLDEI